MMAPSILLYFTIFLITGTLFEETSALTIKNLKVRKRRDIWDEAASEWNNTKNDVRFNLAPSFGTLTLKSLQQLDESLKVMIGGISEMDVPDGFTWEELSFALDTNPLLIRQYNYGVSRMSKIDFKCLRFFGLGSNKRKRLKSIDTWFSRLIGNMDILQDTDIDINGIAKMVSKITIKISKNLFSRKSQKKNLMDLGILRFPDFTKPFFALYRINLFGKCTYKTYLFHQKEKCQIVGLFQREIYYPNKDYIDNLSRGVYYQLLTEVEDLFSDL